MITLEFLSYIQSLDIVLWREGENIRFSAPPDVLTSELRDEIRKRKAEILPLLPSAAPAPAASQSIVPTQRNGVLPLSFAQQRLWFLHQLEPDNPVYNQAFALRLTGVVDTSLLHQSLNAIVARHEVLRTSFATSEDQPVQQIAPALSIPLPTVDLSSAPPTEKEARVQEIAHTEAHAIFDLSKGPLLRATLLRLEEEEHTLVLIVHHIVGDGWSATIFLQELPAFYEALRAGQTARLPELPIQYADFALWQHEQARSGALEPHLAYWSQRLAGAPALLDLPTDHPRTSTPDARGAHVQYRLPTALTASLQALCQRERVTLFMSLLAAFAALLARTSGQDDLIIGTPIANRTRREVEDLIGFFANTLPIRLDLRENPSFSQLLQQARTYALEAYAHQDVPFERLVELLQPERSLSHAPLVQVLLVVQQDGEPVRTFSNLRMELLDVEIEVAKFDLTLTVRQQGEELSCNWEYATQLFERASIQRLAAHFHLLLEGLLAQPEQPIKRVSYLAAAERTQLLEEWNATQVSYPTFKPIHELFEEQVVRAPDAIAVVLEDEQLTYGELNRRANQLAHALRQRGVGPEVLVGICVERSLFLITGLLAILKAGGAFVPLDPSHPHERLDFMLQDSQAAALLTQRSLVERLPNYRGSLLYLDDAQSLEQEPDTNLPNLVTDENLAYVIYTSGSTGQPKGVLIPHHALARHSSLMAERYQLQAHDRVLQFTALTFDISLEQIFPTLIAGARLVLRGPEIWSTAEFHTKVHNFGLTVINLAPAYWHQLAQEWASAPECTQDMPLRLVAVGGDKLLRHYIKLWQQTPLRSVRLLNAYGPAETTITSTLFEVPLLSEYEERMEHMPIGRPTPMRRLYVLDAYGQPVPVGTAGELYIGGHLLARGYLRQPQMTAERFLPDPFVTDSHARMYKTGDLVRYLPDGTLEFLDRADFQVKILGMRVEIGEVEEALRSLPTVQEVVITAREKSRSEKSLIAYVVVSAGQRPTAADLRQSLRAKVPEYMVPAAFLFLDALPLSPNGKIDRTQLPAVSAEMEEIDTDQETALTMMEELVLGVWAGVLARKQIGRQQNFFDLGGHSLLVIRVISQLKTITGIELHVKDVFEHPTIARLALFLEQMMREEERLALPEIQPAPHQDELPLSFAQQRLWFIEQLEPGTSLYMIPLLLRLHGPLQPHILERSLGLVAQRQQSLRAIFPAWRGVPRQVIESDAPLQLPLVDLSSLDEPARREEEERQIQQAIHQPFDLERGPLFRALLLRVQPEEHLLVCSLHHIVADGWSLEILQREIAQCYSSLLAEEAPDLSPLPIQYTDFALWQHEQVRSGALEPHLAYWSQRLAGAPALLDLPTDHPRLSTPDARGAHVQYRLPTALLAGLQALCQRERVTLFMSLLAAFAALLARTSGQDDLIIGTPIANRTRREVEDLIGFFINTLPIRLDLGENPSFADLLQQVRTRALEAYAHQDVPFERLVEQLQPERSLSHAPLMQVLLVVQQDGEPVRTFSNLRMELLDVEVEVAKFDLTLTVRQQGEDLSCDWEYATQLFERASIQRLAEHFHLLLEGLLTQPEQPIKRVSYLTATERTQLLEEWNATRVAYPMLKPIHELFEEQVERAPDAIAVVLEDEQLTYGELNQRANQLAHALRRRGVGPEVMVGVCMERSIELVVGLMGILKAGGAYVPLDPDYPQERLRFLVEDTQSCIVLTQERLRDRLAHLPVPLICLDSEPAELADQPRNNPMVQANLQNLAYIIYTSGSTGKPKGVMNTHRGLSNRLLWMQDAYRLTPEDRVLQKTPYTFDVSVWEFFWPLFTGACLVIARPGIHRESTALIDCICEQQITTLHFVPSMLSLFLQASGVEQCRSVRQVICSGEALSIEHQRQFFTQLDAELYNLYGPTEAAIDVTHWTCQREDERTTVPIGRPIANIQIYVLDQQGQPAPVGVAGELHIGGVGLARGYLKRPELTAEKFVPHPFSQQEGARLYKTGDLVCYQADGTIRYLGRIDHQIKLRGQRIELEEIEVLLKQHPTVQDAVAIVREDQPGDKRLVSYLVAAEGEDINVTALYAHLQKQLPQYMIPSAFIQLEHFPLSANGKLDRAALPAPAQWIRDEKAGEYTAPRTQVEETLAAIWSQVLGIERISVHDNFFVLGGDSIRSIRVLALMKERGLFCSLQQFFQAQTIHDLAAVLQSTQAEKAVRPVIEPFGLLSEDDKALLPADIEDAYPLTALQAGMIYHLLLTADNPMYHNVISFHLRGALNEQALRQALQLLVARHANLRTSFDLGTYSKPLQLVHTAAPLPLEIADLRALPMDEQERIITTFVQQEKTRLFDITSPPLLRLHIFRRTEETFQLTITEYHPILDGWSYHLNLAELFEYHEQISRGETPKPAPLKVLFRDYVALEQEVLQSAEQRNYWLQKLSDSTFLQVPRFQAPGQGAAQPLMRSHDIPLSQQFSDEIWQLSRLSAFPLKSILLAAHVRFMTLLAGSFDVLTGFVSNGRLEEVDGDVVRGIFLLTIPFRLKASSGTWLDFIREVFQAEQEFLPFRRYPLSAIQDDLGGQTLLETAFNYMHFHSVAELFHTTMEIIEPPKTLEETHFTLQTNVWLEPASSRIYLNLRYDASVISEEQIASFGQYFENILKAMVSNPHAPHHQQSFLPLEEAQRHLLAWNRTEVSYPVQGLLHTEFEAQAAQTPDAIALVSEQETLTYGELNARANQLAHYLRKRGVGPEVLVGICLHPGLEMLIGLLGILKAGGAYIPLNPAYPTERQEFMLADAHAPLLLTQHALLDQVPTQAVPVLCLDTHWPLVAGEQQENLAIPMSAEHLAYLIYTSGSTGAPKGVMVSHANVLRLFAVSQGSFQFDQRDVWTLFHSFAFDFSVWEIWGALLYGGRLVIVPYAVSRSPETFSELLATQSVTVLNQTPSAFRQLVLLEKEREWVEALALRWVVFGGEALDAQSVRTWFERYGEVEPRLVNMYGITETTVHVTFSPLRYADVEHTTGTMIGRPLADLQVYILDEYQQPVPVGVVGEMYVGGAGLARGYLNRPQLTSERFVAHPFSTQPGSRLYRTGDRARLWPDGRLEYLGRKDHQVKIRGFRIELGEIEARLESLPQVKTGVVIAREDTPGEKRLVAYVVTHEATSLTSGELRRALLERLPEYMVPAAFVQLEALPLTSQGKLDRRALPAPEQSRPDLEETYVPPQTPTEEILAMVWASALSIDQVGIHDNFFALGGDSIRSIQVLAQARQRGLLFTLQQLFQAQTIFQLARLLVAEEQQHFPLDDGRPGSLLKSADWRNCPADVEDAYPLARLQAGMLFHSQYNKDFGLYQDIMTYHLQAPLKLEYLQEALRHLAARHAILRTSFDLEHFSEPLQLVHRSAVIPLQVRDLRGYSQEDQEKLLANWIERQERQPFDCTYAPLLRFFIHIRSDHSFQLTLNCHHAVLDGWSVASLLTELFTHYFTLLEERALPMEDPLKAHYRDFIAREQFLVHSEEARLYWARVLAGNTHLTLPQWVQADWKKENTTSHEFPVPLSQELSERLNHLARILAVPMKTVLLAVHLKVLSVLSGQTDILTGLVSNGRPETPDGERLLGLFLNTLPLRLTLQQETWIELIQRVFAAECELLPYRCYPLAEIQRQQGEGSLFDTLFTFTRFHVYNALANVKNFQVISATGIAKTNFALDVRFSQDTLSSQIRLTLACSLDERSLAQVETLAGYFVSALNALVDNPHALYTQQSLLSSTELQRMLVEWNATDVETPRETFVHTRIEEQARRTPTAIAVIHENEQLTYEQLNERANQLAHHLRELGVGPEIRVGICMRRGVEMLIGLLGILKAGGAYVPLDPAYPQARLAFMLDDADVTVLLTQASCLSALPPYEGQIVCLDTDRPEIAQKDRSPLALSPVLSPDSLAYIIYTSGTTGRPKGAMITHEGLMNYLSWAATTYGVERGQGSAVHSSLSFDLTVTSLFTPLLVGRGVVMVEETAGVEGLARVIRRSGPLSLLKLTPAHMLLLETILEPEEMAGIEATLVIGGEALLGSNLEKWQRWAPRARYINEYGPTETVVGCCAYEAPAQTGQAAHIPIGRPIKNTRLYVLDAYLQPVPAGVAGELYIAGEGVARGYLQRPEVTAERFLPDPFSREPGRRMYRSGDLARYRVDGILEYLGRADHQVKLRGFRIEPGEIEVCLEEHPLIEQAVVLAREDQPGEKRLVAYIRSAAEQAHLSWTDLHTFLGERLPVYMIPASFVSVLTFPLTSNGKVDRQALPPPERDQLTDSGDRTPPQTDVEQMLARIWTELLEVEGIGLEDDFFALGGHSLLGTQLVTRIRRAFQVDFPLATLFEIPKLGDQALFIEDLILSEIEQLSEVEG